MTTAPTATFGRVLTAMVTPFTADGALDLDGARKLAIHLTTDGGNDGLVIAGTTGESPTLTHDEQVALIEAVVEAVDVPVIAGAGSNDTKAAIELTDRTTGLELLAFFMSPATTTARRRPVSTITFVRVPRPLTSQCCSTIFQVAPVARSTPTR